MPPFIKSPMYAVAIAAAALAGTSYLKSNIFSLFLLSLRLQFEFQTFLRFYVSGGKANTTPVLELFGLEDSHILRVLYKHHSHIIIV